jgi:four helix bundle protein
MGDYKKLRVWEEACNYADRVERMARQLPQPDRRWAFDQLVRAAHAIHENIAEGWGFDTDPQRLKYCRQALSTGNESEDQLLALERKGLLIGEFAALPREARSVCAMLGSLKLTLEAAVAKQGPRHKVRRRNNPTAADRQMPTPGPDGREPSGKPGDKTPD